MALFIEGAGDTKVYERHPFLKAGVYEVLEVIGLKGFLNRQKQKMIAAEYKVLESSGDDPNKAGTSAVHLINISKDGALANVMKLVGALLNKPAKQVTDVDLNAMIQSPDNTKPSPAIGYKVKAEAALVPTKDGKGHWLNVEYTHIPSTTATAAPAAGEVTSTGRVTKK